MDVDVLRGLGNNSIPETEQLYAGGGDVGLKLPGSAAMHYGKPLVSAESFVWSGRSHGTTPLKAKAAADKLFIAGVNHIFYHGVPYTWHGGNPGEIYGSEGWHPFSNPDSEGMTFASFISPTNPLWPGFSQLNQYIGRSQYLLRAGNPDVDVLIYYPFVGFPSSYGESDTIANEPLAQGRFPIAEPSSPDIHGLLSGLFPDDGPDKRVAWLEALSPLIHAINRQGLTWAWTGEDPLKEGVSNPDHFKHGGNFQAILVANIVSMEMSASSQLQNLAERGQKIFVFGDTPKGVPGLANYQSESAVVQQNFRSMHQKGTESISDIEEWESALRTFDKGPFSVAEGTETRSIRRSLNDGQIMLVTNPKAEGTELIIELHNRKPVWLFDAERSELWQANPTGDTLKIGLQAYESIFVIQSEGISLSSNARTCRPESSTTQDIDQWDVPETGNTLIDWRGVPGLAERAKSLTYSADLDIATKNGRYSLDFEMIHGIAHLTVNGMDIGLVGSPPFRADISEALQPGKNSIQLELIPAMRNALIKRAEDGDTRYRQFLEFTGQYQAAGIVGQVTLLNCE